MAYADVNFPSKAALKRALKAGDKIGVFNPGAPVTPEIPRDFSGDVTLAGPHYPKPHRWYAEVRVEMGVITRVIS